MGAGAKGRQRCLPFFFLGFIINSSMKIKFFILSFIFSSSFFGLTENVSADVISCRVPDDYDYIGNSYGFANVWILM